MCSIDRSFSKTPPPFAVHQEQDLEGHRGIAGHRSQLLGRLHAQEALRQESPALRVPVRPRRHRPGAHPAADRARLRQEEEAAPRTAATRALAGLAGLEGLLLRAELRERWTGQLGPAWSPTGTSVWRAAGRLPSGLPQQRPVLFGSSGSERIAWRRAAQAPGSAIFRLVSQAVLTPSSEIGRLGRFGARTAHCRSKR